jgi:hypothetical protein
MTAGRALGWMVGLLALALSGCTSHWNATLVGEDLSHVQSVFLVVGPADKVAIQGDNWKAIAQPENVDLYTCYWKFDPRALPLNLTYYHWLNSSFYYLCSSVVASFPLDPILSNDVTVLEFWRAAGYKGIAYGLMLVIADVFLASVTIDGVRSEERCGAGSRASPCSWCARTASSSQ